MSEDRLQNVPQLSQATMPPERWQRILQLAQEASRLSPEEREKFLATACANDPALRHEVEAALQSPELLQPAPEPLPLEPSEIGKLIGPYRLKRVLGRGGMGVVYLAVRDDDAYQKRVAIKLIKKGMDSEEIIKRFRNERQALAALEHPNIARLLEGGTTEDGRPYFVMEYIEGTPIDKYCDDHKLNIMERLELFRAACSAVHYAHQNLIVHRDLKPSNILITAEGVPKLLDFGIAKLLNPEMSPEPLTITKTEIRLMTPEYASPEQVRGDIIKTTSDVYSLGVVLYELLTGHRPYRLTSRLRQEIERVICEVEPEKPSTAISRVEENLAEENRPATKLTPDTVSKVREGNPDKLRRRLAGDLDNIILMAMRKEPNRRYGSVEQFSEDLRRHLVGLTVIARKDTAGYRMSKFVNRHKVGVAAAAAFTVLVLGFAITTKIQSNRIAAQAKQIALERDKAQEVSKFLVELFEVSDPSQAKGDTITAREILDKGAERIEKELKDQPEVQATLMNTIGVVYGTLGLYDRSRQLLETALATRKQLYGEEEHVESATSMHNLAKAYYSLGKYAKAESLSFAALELRRKLLGSNHKDIAENLHDLAVLFSDQGKYSRAESLFFDALAMWRALPSNESLKASGTLNALGVMYRGKGEREKAAACHQEALLILQSMPDSGGVDRAHSINNLALLLKDKGDYDEAQKLYQQVLPIYRRYLGNEHPEVAICINNLATVLKNKKQYDLAEQLLREALVIKRKTMGSNHPSVATSLNNLAGVLQEKGDYDAAEFSFREALGILRAAFGNEHPNIAAAMNNLGLLLGLKGNFVEAEKLFRSSLAMRRKLLGDKHPGVATSLKNLARVLDEMKRPAEALPIHLEALTIFQQTNPSGHWVIGDEQSSMGRSLSALRRFGEAEPHLVSGYSILRDKLGVHDERTQKALHLIIDLYKAWGKPAKVAEYRALLPKPENAQPQSASK